MFTRIAILGLGQLGGSFALACRRAGIHAEIVGYDPQAASAEHLLRLSAIDAVLPLAEVVRNADLVILAAPLRTYPDLARSIASHLAPQAIVTDVGSVKCSMAALVDLLPEGQEIVPGHPISGSEKSGASASRGDLFEDKLCACLAPTASDCVCGSELHGPTRRRSARRRRDPATVPSYLAVKSAHVDGCIS
jgi:prephenate dehydrogenase